MYATMYNHNVQPYDIKKYNTIPPNNIPYTNTIKPNQIIFSLFLMPIIIHILCQKDKSLIYRNIHFYLRMFHPIMGQLIPDME